MKIKTDVLYVVIIITCIFIVSACASPGTDPLLASNAVPQSEGNNAGIPNLKKGDTFDTTFSSNSFIKRMIFTISNENTKKNTDYYSADVLTYFEFMDDPVEGKSELYKNTLEPKSLQFGFKKGNKSLFVKTETIQDYISSSPFPLEVGKSWSVTLTETSERTMNGRVVSSENKTIKKRYYVDSIEDVSIPLGQFTCFKIMKYDVSDELVSIKWVPKETKFIEIKGIMLEPDVSFEMQSYKVH